MNGFDYWFWSRRHKPSETAVSSESPTESEAKTELPEGVTLPDPGDFEVVIKDVRYADRFQSKRSGLTYFPVQFSFDLNGVERYIRVYGFLSMAGMLQATKEFWIGRAVKIRIKHIKVPKEDDNGPYEQTYADIDFRGLA